MFVRTPRAWECSKQPREKETPEAVYSQRRQLRRKFLRTAGVTAGAIGAMATLPASLATARAEKPLYPAQKNFRYGKLDRPLTPEKLVVNYNNYYEFGSSKKIQEKAQKLPLRPWTVKLSGLVAKEQTLDIDALLRKVNLEERLYRHRCVEAWSMAVPWTGFPLEELVKLADPLSGAKYLKMTAFLLPEVAIGQKASWYPWPYAEGLTIAEATNPLAFLVTGLYGKPLLPQSGAPLRLAVPWKYGFKSIKGIVEFSFVEKRPLSFWASQGDEYGFWANVNPKVPHARWSQKQETMLGEEEPRPTLLYNGYAEQVAHLYQGLENERLFT